MASPLIEAKASKATSAHDHARRRSSTHSRGTKPRKPKLGDFLRVNTELDQLGTELKAAIEETRPPASPPASRPASRPPSPLVTPPVTHPARGRVVPSLLEILQRKVGNIDEAAGRGWSVTDDDDELPASAVEDDSHGNSDDASIGVPVSPATATTSPVVHVVDTDSLSLLTVPHADLKVLHEARPASGCTIYYLHPLSPYQELQRSHRIKLAHLAMARRTSSAATQLTLPWDANGNYASGSAPPTTSPRSQGSIAPLYSVSKTVQLDIITAWLDEAVSDDDLSRAEHAASSQPIHVFVDMSNIVIGFYDRIKAGRNMAREERVLAPAFFFEGFARCLERFRPCAKRVLATSTRAGAATPGYLLEAKCAGYEMNVLQRIRVAKKTFHRHSSYHSQHGQNQPGGVYLPDPSAHAAGFREQGVDELLHLKMMQSLLDTPAPATMVLATGDAAKAEFSDGFHRNVVRALERGWHVEVIGWRDNMSSAWFDAPFLRRWARQLRIFFLDQLVEDLIPSYYV